MSSHKLTPSEGGGMDQPGGGGASEVPGRAAGYLGNQRGRRQFERDHHREQTGNSCFVPAAE